MVPNWVYFGLREDFKLTTELFEKVRHSRNQAIKNSLNEAILLVSINEAFLWDKTLRFSGNQKLCMKVIRIFNAQPVKISNFNAPLTRKKAQWPFFYCTFLMFISWMLITPSLKKKGLIVEQFQGNYLKSRLIDWLIISRTILIFIIYKFRPA